MNLYKVTLSNDHVAFVVGEDETSAGRAAENVSKEKWPPASSYDSASDRYVTTTELVATEDKKHKLADLVFIRQVPPPLYRFENNE
jgi:hypothetical protein